MGQCQDKVGIRCRIIIMSEECHYFSAPLSTQLEEGNCFVYGMTGCHLLHKYERHQTLAINQCSLGLHSHIKT